MSTAQGYTISTHLSTAFAEYTPMQSTPYRPFLHLVAALALCGLGLGAGVSTAAEAQRHFKGPGAAIDALLEAVQTRSPAKLDALFGPGAKDIRSSGDPVADKAALESFLTAAKERTELQFATPSRVLLSFGDDDWPFPIPLVKSGKGWSFDTTAGKEEIINRRIGRNELHTIAVMRELVTAQEEYRAADPTGSGLHTYAQKISSSKGHRDGLYWPAEAGTGESPLGERIATAVKEGYEGADTGKPIPYHGYYFHILTAQGRHAPGGVKSYLNGGKMTGGFAVLAWPADYGNSGIKSFLVNQQGILYERDLGADTEKRAAAITEYDPDEGWDPVTAAP